MASWIIWCKEAIDFCKCIVYFFVWLVTEHICGLLLLLFLFLFKFSWAFLVTLAALVASFVLLLRWRWRWRCLLLCVVFPFFAVVFFVGNCFLRRLLFFFIGVLPFAPLWSFLYAFYSMVLIVLCAGVPSSIFFKSFAACLVSASFNLSCLYSCILSMSSEVAACW